MLARRAMAIGGPEVVAGGGGGGGASACELAAASTGAAAAGLLARSLAGTEGGALGADLNANFFFGAKLERVS